eukprot:TRINITY_DN689_c0_g1_i1.p1 TRINITY_DN689_c0_g1~~TRINITY_DN689_c0_g1_i1.p1  ORF type:complete len:966 (+),score=430.56 TRINITY_DN689_c0_g1_i1:72-2969(+)
MDGEYDEFGNFIGKIEESSSEPSSESSEDESEEESEESSGEQGEADMEEVGAGAVVLHEDKKFYPDADEVYGQGTEVIVGEEDTQTIEQPIIAPKVEKHFHTKEKKSKKVGQQASYIQHVMHEPNFMRNVSVIGHLGHGKTGFMDYLLGETGRVCDVRLDEQDRAMSVKATPVSMLLENHKGKNFLFNIMDTPGHVGLADEACASMALSDGVVLVVDVVEGVMMNTEKLMQHALADGLPMVLVLNKIDRLILELKIPPADAYRKMCHVLGEINSLIAAAPLNPAYAAPPRFSPELGNVCFASAKYGYSFTLKSFARIYAEYYGRLDVDRFVARLWGNVYYNKETKKFSKHNTNENEMEPDPLAFCAFILEPLYKMTGSVISEDPKGLQPVLDDLGVKVWRNESKLDAEPLLKLVASRFFGDPSGFTDMVCEHIPTPKAAAAARVPHIYTGDLTTPTAQSMAACSPEGELMVYITKLFSRDDAETFDAYGRVMSGTLYPNTQIRVLGEAYTREDPEDMAVAETQKLWLAQGRHRLEVESAPAGSWVLIEGVDNTILKTATVCATNNDDACVFRPLSFSGTSVVKIAVEPLVPSELPKMIEGLRKVNKTYPLANIKKEESGEHIIIGTGEMHLDCIMHDLRKMYADIEVKVADPVTTFCETVIETSSLKCYAETLNKRNKITMIAEPLEKGLAEAIERRDVSLDMDKKVVRTFFEEKYGWDTLAARSVWAFGPDTSGPNVLLDDTIASETNRKGLLSIKDSVVQGFQWAAREGPLCDEKIRSTKFKLLDATVADEVIHRGSGQIIPTARRVAYSAFLMATPRLLEPVYNVEIITAGEDCLEAVYTIMARRRGHLTYEGGKPGTPLWTLKGYIPIMDSFGLETDIRSHTQGQAFVQSTFDHWQVVPGDPLDKDIVLRPLEPSQPSALARDYMVKTRLRKGMPADVSINKFLDDPMLLELARQDVERGM